MSSADKKPEIPARPAGAMRGFLKLIVALDSSRFALNRVKSALLLLALLTVFGILGYGLPAFLSWYF